MAETNANTNNEKIKRKRSANWDQIEKNLLKSCMTGFVTIIENKNTDTNTNKSKTAAWQRVWRRFNELNNRVRDLAEVKQQWRTMKLDAKKNMSEGKTLKKCTGGGPKPPSSSPDTLEILRMIPQEFESDVNVFDSDSIGISVKKQNILFDGSTGTQEIVLTPLVNTDKNITTTSSKLNVPHEKPPVLKRKLPFNDNNKPKHCDKEFAKERNHVLLSCIREEHEYKMENLMERHRFTTEEHNLKIEQMLETHSLLKEEAQLRIQKLKLEIAQLQRKNNY